MKTFKVLAACSVFALTACGGGGGDGGATPPPVATVPPITLAQLQGFWNGPVSGASLGGASSVRSVVLSDGSAWLFLHNAQDDLVGLATAKLAVAGQSFSGSGTRYDVSGARADSVAVSGAAPGTTSFNVSVAATGGTSALMLASDARYNTPVTRADAVGNWRFTKAGATIVANWSIDANGVLSGSSTLGCSYNGTVAPHGSVAVFDIALTETCTGGVTQLNGIAKLNTAKTFLTFGMTTVNGAQAEMIVAQKI